MHHHTPDEQAPSHYWAGVCQQRCPSIRADESIVAAVPNEESHLRRCVEAHDAGLLLSCDRLVSRIHRLCKMADNEMKQRVVEGALADHNDEIARQNEAFHGMHPSYHVPLSD